MKSGPHWQGSRILLLSPRSTFSRLFLSYEGSLAPEDPKEEAVLQRALNQAHDLVSREGPMW